MKRYAQIVLHAGLSKTGSSSIQVNCERYCDRLRAAGIVYPVFLFDGAPLQTHSIPLTVAVARSPGRYGLRLPQRFPGREQELIRECASQFEAILGQGDGNTLLLSTELIENFDAEDMAALRARLAAHTQRLRVVAFIRSPQSSLESLLQERTRGGASVQPAALVGRVRSKYENLRRGFADCLEIVNFHEAVQHRGGLVGAFMELLDPGDSRLCDLPFETANERLGIEAFRIMSAINARYPRREQAVHGVERLPGDMEPLARIPGPPFRLEQFEGSDVYADCLAEARWLEAQLGLQFPEDVREEPTPLWQEPALEALPRALLELRDHRLRDCAVEAVRNEAESLAATRGQTAERLLRIADSVPV